jgi:hypothetical protein
MDDFHDLEWQFRADIYWLSVLVGVLSLPFAAFVLPVLSTLLLHVRPTGYNRAGECVPVQRKKDPVAADPMSSEPGDAAKPLDAVA